jgi:hypothetical protein
VILPVGLLHPVKEGLHLPDGDFFNFSGDFFDVPDKSCLTPAKEARDASYHPNGALSLTPLVQFPLQFLDGLVAISEATGIERFILPEHLQLLGRDLRAIAILSLSRCIPKAFRSLSGLERSLSHLRFSRSKARIR